MNIQALPSWVRFALTAIAISTVTACSSTAAAPTASRSSSATASQAAWPSGGPVPDALSGTWRAHNADAGAFRASLILNGNAYQVGGSTLQTGNVVVNGDTMLFFNGFNCGLRLPAGIGTYHWSLDGAGALSLQIDSDPCGRAGDLGDSTWDRVR